MICLISWVKLVFLFLLSAYLGAMKHVMKKTNNPFPTWLFFISVVQQILQLTRITIHYIDTKKFYDWKSICSIKFVFKIYTIQEYH